MVEKQLQEQKEITKKMESEQATLRDANRSLESKLALAEQQISNFKDQHSLEKDTLNLQINELKESKKQLNKQISDQQLKIAKSENLEKEIVEVQKQLELQKVSNQVKSEEQDKQKQEQEIKNS